MFGHVSGLTPAITAEASTGTPLSFSQSATEDDLVSFVWKQKSDRGKMRGFSSYPPNLTVLNTSVLKHTKTENEIYVLKVKSCKSGFGSLDFFFFF